MRNDITKIRNMFGDIIISIWELVGPMIIQLIIWNRDNRRKKENKAHREKWLSMIKYG